MATPVRRIDGPRRRLVRYAAAAACLSSAPAALAQDPCAAGRQHYQDPDTLPQACQELDACYREQPTAKNLLWLANCHSAQGLAATAEREILRARPDATSKDAAWATELLETVRRNGPSLRLEIHGDEEAKKGASFLVDGKPVDAKDLTEAKLVDAGEHTIVFRTTYLEYTDRLRFFRGARAVPISRTVGRVDIFAFPRAPASLAVTLDGVPIDTSKLGTPATMITGKHRLDVSFEGRPPYTQELTVAESGPPARARIAAPEGKPAGAECVADAQCASLSCAGDHCCAQSCTTKGATCSADGACQKLDDPTAAGGVVLGFGVVSLVAATTSAFVWLGSAVAAGKDSCTSDPGCSWPGTKTRSMWATIIAGAPGAVLFTAGALAIRYPPRAPRLVPVASPGGAALLLTGTF